ncbi:MAG: EAL domain-containing protein, partial [Nitrospira sp.]|nr:EAL domain-containing protein [Nitrospira sp.]
MENARKTKSGFSFYNETGDERRLDRLQVISELRRAIEHEDLLLHYQPKVDFRTGDIQGVEALVRWQHPERGLIPPSEFILLAEQSGLIKPLTSWVRNTALWQCGAWHQQGLDLSMAFNITPSSLQDTAFPDWLAKMIKTYNVPPPLVELEITESALMENPQRAVEVVTRLNAMGVRLSIDDFGTGYSSMAYLTKLPVANIKIDKSFVTNMLADEKDAVVVRCTIDLGHHLGLKVVAEGVENQPIWDQLAALGCDLCQGYFISRPLPAEELVHWLIAWSGELRRKRDMAQA